MNIALSLNKINNLCNNEGVCISSFKTNGVNVFKIDYLKEMPVQLIKLGLIGYIIEGTIEIIYNNLNKRFIEGDVIIVPDVIGKDYETRIVSEKATIYFIDSKN